MHFSCSRIFGSFLLEKCSLLKMTRRAFSALRVIRIEGKMIQSCSRTFGSFLSEKCSLLKICEFNRHGNNFPSYVRGRGPVAGLNVFACGPASCRKVALSSLQVALSSLQVALSCRKVHRLCRGLVDFALSLSSLPGVHCLRLRSALLDTRWVVSQTHCRDLSVWSNTRCCA